MERTLLDDAKWALAVLVGATLGYLLLDVDDPSLLIGALIGVVAVVCVVNILRHVRHRRAG